MKIFLFGFIWYIQVNYSFPINQFNLLYLLFSSSYEGLLRIGTKMNVIYVCMYNVILSTLNKSLVTPEDKTHT